ncbi:hypothetical protein RB195_002274 [Necator americanus]|uniref:PDZ domain-containing protein n=1 Tax=Necator americanus TaxID=51031 RepID=A0ABR1DI81_NECAM
MILQQQLFRKPPTSTNCFSLSLTYSILPRKTSCTINIFKPDMDKLFGGIFEHSGMLSVLVKGQAVEVELSEIEGLFGLTAIDNGRCRLFIRRVKNDSTESRARPALDIGQLVEKNDDVLVTGMRHCEVVPNFRDIPIGNTFKMLVVSPKQSGF